MYTVLQIVEIKKTIVKKQKESGKLKSGEEANKTASYVLTVNI